jgi:MFS transporter, SHS family, sialic acid transporter
MRVLATSDLTPANSLVSEQPMTNDPRSTTAGHDRTVVIEAASKQHSAAGSQGNGLRKEHWFVLMAAFLGWMFDGLEMGLFPVVARPAIQDLMRATTTSEHDVLQWISYLTALFLLGAACGGLIFGWMGDRIGRVRSMALSIFVYSGFTGLCYFAAAPWQLGACRFVAAMGMGGEWALGVALVMECWPEKLRPLMAGIIGAAGNVGYLIIGLMATQFKVTPDSWRWTMLAGAAPALLAMLVLAVIPESKRWQQAVRNANAKPIREIFTTKLLWPTLLGITFSSVALIGTWASVTGFLPSWAGELAPTDPYAKGWAMCLVSIGAIIGCFFSPLIGGKIGRRPAYFGLCLFSLVACAALFRGLTEYGTLFLAASAIAGCATASFYGWLPLYLPELFPTRVRATAQGLCYNFGRIFAAVGTLGMVQLKDFFDPSRSDGWTTTPIGQLLTFTNSSSVYARACAAITLIYIVGMVVIWLAPETKGKPLPE